MTVYDDQGRAHNVVGTGAKDYWSRRDNRYPGCTCPSWRYSPRAQRPTSPDCPAHAWITAGAELRRPASQAADLLSLDDMGGH